MIEVKKCADCGVELIDKRKKYCNSCTVKRMQNRNNKKR